MSKNIVFEGWLTKSPPIKRIWRTKWRRRWFALRQSGELPGQYFLDYYADRNCRRLKGTINLDLCEQVDAGLHMERNTHSTLDPKLRGSVFTIQTQSRTYHLEADSESDMERWVDAICRVCGLRATEESPNVLVTYQNNVSAISVANEQYDSTGPYIPISECITGVRAQDSRRAFTFDPKNIVISSRTPFERDARAHPIYMSQPHIRPHNNNAEFSENDSNLSEDESKSLNASQPNIRDWSVAKSFTKSTASPNSNGSSEDGPPVPPRPPKTFAMSRDMSQRESFQPPKFLEPVETDRECESPGRTFPWIRTARRMSGTAPQSPRRYTHAVARHDDDDEGYALDHVSMQYCNLSIIPPTVDRNLKPRHSSHCMHYMSGHMHDDRSDVLQYLDLDLHTSKPIPSKRQQIPGKVIDINHSKSLSAADTDSAYKTVDFLKTEAFNITRQDAEASRNTQQ